VLVIRQESASRPVAPYTVIHANNPNCHTRICAVDYESRTRRVVVTRITPFFMDFQSAQEEVGAIFLVDRVGEDIVVEGEGVTITVGWLVG